MNRPKIFLYLLLFLIIFSGCATSPPKNINNACRIFDEKSKWYKASYKSYKKWGVPVHVQLAIMHQESRFVSDAQPPRRTLLWFIPWTRPSDAFGYAQVLDSTWEWYKDKTGNWFADRDDYKDAVDFIGWYGNISYNTLKISKWDAYGQYLAYHEGHGGYKRRTYLKKKWLMRVAEKVKANANRYALQLKQCKN
ncbi:transglycosylase SLT domain-containing protein [Desulfobacula sp.]|uniref:transglycosylase SLT domain-containing protein n=1 Tax=Desulfobacula sp. TaxID=2593537 RepID=UPI0039B86866|nr:transglycosylase SLT domain-containing protein [Desulfobacula sp.]